MFFCNRGIVFVVDKTKRQTKIGEGLCQIWYSSLKLMWPWKIHWILGMDIPTFAREVCIHPSGKAWSSLPGEPPVSNESSCIDGPMGCLVVKCGGVCHSGLHQYHSNNQLIINYCLRCLSKAPKKIVDQFFVRPTGEFHRPSDHPFFPRVDARGHRLWKDSGR